MAELSDTPNEHRVLGGYKATLHNPNVSEQAKDHAAEVLEDRGIAANDGKFHPHHDHSEHFTRHEDAHHNHDSKHHAEHALKDFKREEDVEHENRVLGGYKATLHNPNSTDEAKEHAKAMLKQHGVEV